MSSTLETILKRRTGEGRFYWVAWVEKRIHDCSRPSTNSPSGREMDPSTNWMADLAKEIWRVVPPHCGWGVDANIACSEAISLILTLWTCRVEKMKNYSPRYSVKVRKTVLRNNSYLLALTECVVDESQDHLYFPDREWVSPFLEKKKK